MELGNCGTICCWSSLSELHDVFPRLNNGGQSNVDRCYSLGSMWRQWDGWKVGKAAQENVPKGSGGLRFRMSEGENKGRVLVIMAVLFCGVLEDVRICSEEGGKLCEYVEDVSSGWEKEEKKSKFLGFLLRLHNYASCNSGGP